MIYNEFLASLTDLVDYEVSTPQDGDLLFVTMNRPSLYFNHAVCGIFRLKQGFGASGKTGDGVYIIPSAVLADWYWEKVYKNVLKSFSSGVVTLADAASVVVNHDADTGNTRYPEVVKWVQDSSQATMDRDNIVSYQNLDLTELYIPLDGLHNYPYLQLAKRYQLVADQDVSHLYAVSSNYDAYAILHKDWNVYVRTSAGVASYSLVSNVWTLQGEQTGSGSRVPTEFKSCCGGVGVALYYDGNNFTTQVYKLTGSVWDMIAGLDEGPFIDFEEGSYKSGRGGATLRDSNLDVLTTWDEPAYQYWSMYRTNAEIIVSFSSPNYPSTQTSWDAIRGCNNKGKMNEWLYCPSAILHTSYYDVGEDVSVDVITPDGSELWEIYNSASHAGFLHGIDSPYIFATDAQKVWEVTAQSGGVPTNMQSSNLYPGVLTYNLESGSGKGYSPFGASNDGRILSNNYALTLSGLSVYFGGRSQRVCALQDLEDPGGLRTGATYQQPPFFMHLPNDQIWLGDPLDNQVHHVCHINTFDEYIDYAIVYADILQAPSAITSVAIGTISEPIGTQVRFLVRASNGTMYKWSGSAWVSTTDLYAGNTKAEWESVANWPQLHTDIGSLDGLDFLVCLISTSGIATPGFIDMTVDYTKGTDFVLAAELTHGTAAKLEVTIVSATQTNVKNVSGASLTLEAKIFLMG